MKLVAVGAVSIVALLVLLLNLIDNSSAPSWLVFVLLVGSFLLFKLLGTDEFFKSITRDDDRLTTTVVVTALAVFGIGYLGSLFGLLPEAESAEVMIGGVLLLIYVRIVVGVIAQLLRKR